MAIRFRHICHGSLKGAQCSVLVTVGYVLVFARSVGSEMAQMECCDSQNASHQEVMVKALFGNRDPPKPVRIRSVRGCVACLGDKLV